MTNSRETPSNKENDKKTEFLLIVDKKADICCNEKSLISFINSHKNISISGRKIKNNTKEYPLKLTQTDTPNVDLTSFHITINFKEEDIKNINNLQRNLRTLFGPIDNISIQTIWDDTSFYFAKKGYPLIHEVENLMRKLITKFMVANVGHDWYSTTTPDEIKFLIKGSEDDCSFLYHANFDHLKDFLFKPRQGLSLENFLKEVENSAPNTNFKAAEINKLKPKSNWERYFKSHIPNDEKEIIKKWDNLYRLRCKIAHNNFFNKKDYDNLKKNHESIKKILEDAIIKLDEIKIDEDDRNEIVSERTNELIDSFEIALPVDRYQAYLERLQKLKELNSSVNTYDRIRKLMETNYPTYLNRMVEELNKPNISTTMLDRLRKIRELFSYFDTDDKLED